MSENEDGNAEDMVEMAGDDGEDVESTDSMTDDDVVAEPGMIRFVGLIVPLIVIAGIVGVVWATVDLPDLLPDLFEPPMVEFRGRIFYNDEPLAGASIESKPLQKGRRGGIAFSEDDGQFQMMTDIEGKYVKKIYVGEYQLKVAAYGDGPPGGAPPLVTPAKYNSFQKSGLTIQVTQDEAKNTIELRLTD